MEISFSDNIIPTPEDWENTKSIIKVIGVGGGGCNVVTGMFNEKIHDVEFVICNTDKQSLSISNVPEKIRLGSKGLGAGLDPENGRHAAEESLEKIKQALSDSSEMVFIMAGMGGGTGTGAAPVIAKMAKNMGKLTVGVVTVPFRDEGPDFFRRAILGIRELKKHVDCLIIIDNQKLYEFFGDLDVDEAFLQVNEVLSNAVKSIAELITRPGIMNIDFADVKKCLKNSGMALIGTGTASGPDRVTRAVEAAFESPLLSDCDLTTTKGVLVNITYSNDHKPKMSEVGQIADYARNYTGNPLNFKRGTAIDPKLGENISVTIIATGFNLQDLPQLDISDEDNDRVMIGGIYGTHDYTDQNITRINIPEIPDDTPVVKAVHEDDEEPGNDNDGNGQAEEEVVIPTPAPKAYVKHNGKPALIIEVGEDITKYENQPAYMRRNQKLQEHIQRMEQESGEMKLEQINGSHHLSSDNSYLHQTQD